MSQIKPYKRCKKCGALIVSGSLCEDCKPMTNGDKIRAMTDEELADFMAESICDSVDICMNDTPCRECRLAWLKQEAGEDAGTD